MMTTNHIRKVDLKKLRLLSFLSILLFFSCSESETFNKTSPENNQENPYSIGRVGNPENVEVSPKTGVLLMGGSSDVDEAMEWLIEQSDNGDIVIIRVSGGAAYNQYLYDLGSANSIETLLINSDQAANNERVAETIREADALFIAGGNQADYIRFWENSETEEAIQYLIHEKKVPIGGTSAGSAVMGEFVFSALNGTVTSEEALSNPFNERVTVSRSSLVNHPFLAGVLTDQHFSQRDREGRTTVFLARIIDQYGYEDEETAIRAVAVDERTALSIDENGGMTVFGENSVFFIAPKSDSLMPEILTPGLPMTWGENEHSMNVYIANDRTDISYKFNELPEEWSEMWRVSDGRLIQTVR